MKQSAARNEVIARLRGEILSSGGTVFSSYVNDHPDLGPLNKAFPGHCFPFRGTHEFISHTSETAAATLGFMAGLLSRIMKGPEMAVWVGAHRMLFPPALQTFCIVPDRIIFIDLVTEKEMLWVVEECLKCNALAAVVGEIPDVPPIALRRLQLAIEKSGVPCLLHRHRPRSVENTVCTTRWMISPMASLREAGLPGVGDPQWQVSLLKVRNGKPGNWPITWDGQQFQHGGSESTEQQNIYIKAG
ncbi:ImuA family protein [Chitinophaga nivalis]|uniref:Error-prone repair protein ImuA n=1 Tax=Chitinophaga nivalis TaxID=2991709 RepID=A0ABT3IN42_9BACT|nr:Error-prone repair protein ImuA [Chitinophaga nivalis]MCW3464940.1 Error-prone repair protein ImuA [Chitinophaga nivalis]MCW3485368.1 Error-prone repair protein ImuA [Chitinophaga nivalis]